MGYAIETSHGIYPIGTWRHIASRETLQESVQFCLKHGSEYRVVGEQGKEIFSFNLLQDYIDFVNLRQQAFLKKLRDPLYVDPQLGESKFTNVQRVFDRVSQYQLREVMYCHDQSPEELLLRVFIFDQFKTLEFWQYLKDKDYIPTIKTFSSEQFVKVIGDNKLFTNAYMVPGKPGELKSKTVGDRADQLISILGLKEGRKLETTKGIDLFSSLEKVSGIADFLGSQVVFDLLWHETFKDWEPLYVLGKGAKRGAVKLGLLEGLGKPKPGVAKFVLETLKAQIESSGYRYATAGGVDIPINFADYQSTLCETDKYYRLIHKDISAGKNEPTEIKNKYKPGPPIDYVVPGHWVGKSGLVRVDS